jgi:hypothetical protein
MPYKDPFLLKFKKEVLSPRRHIVNEEYEYDEYLSMVIVVEAGLKMPAIYSKYGIPMTKKEDLEKGEDAKDTLMWK